MNMNRILKNIKAFNSYAINKPERIKELVSVVSRQINDDKNKKSKAAIKRIEKNKEWLFVYKILLALNESYKIEI